MHNLVVCTLCSCYIWATLGLPPVWYKSAPYRSRAIIDPRGVLREFGTVLPEDIEVRVWDSTEAALRLAIAGCGITRLADLMVSEAIRKGQLNSVLAETHVAEPVPLSAVYPQGRHRMPKVRAFLDFLVERPAGCAFAAANIG